VQAPTYLRCGGWTNEAKGSSYQSKHPKMGMIIDFQAWSKHYATMGVLIP